MANSYLSLIKQSASPDIIVGNIMTYTVTAINYGSIPLTNVTVNDLFPPELEFINGSVKIDTIPMPTENILLGVNLTTLAAGESRTLTMDAKVLSIGTGTITNTSNADFYYTLPDTTFTQFGTAQSNPVSINVYNADLSITKTSNTSHASIYDDITYTVNIENIGNLDVTNVIFKDSLPDVVKLEEGSFTINGVVVNSVDLGKGINIGTILQQHTTTITYKVKLLGSTCSGNVTNYATALFNYTLPSGITQTKQVSDDSNATVIITVSPSSFRQIYVDEYLDIPCAKPDIETINNVMGEVEILSSYIIQTQVGTSVEGQQLSGYKLIVHGALKEVVEYTANEPSQSVHSAHYNVLFSNFIILPQNVNSIGKLEVEGIIESISTTKIDERSFYNNASILLSAKIKYS